MPKPLVVSPFGLNLTASGNTRLCEYAVVLFHDKTSEPDVIQFLSLVV